MMVKFCMEQEKTSSDSISLNSSSSIGKSISSYEQEMNLIDEIIAKLQPILKKINQITTNQTYSFD